MVAMLAGEGKQNGKAERGQASLSRCDTQELRTGTFSSTLTAFADHYGHRPSGSLHAVAPKNAQPLGQTLATQLAECSSCERSILWYNICVPSRPPG